MKYPEIKILLDITDDNKKYIGFPGGGELGKRSKFGGDPNWIQGEEWPLCNCNKRMSFYAQLDSLGLDMGIGDCSLIYIFICKKCNTVKSLAQSA